MAGYGANPEQGEVERASEVPPSHWVDATDELLLADLGSSLVTFAEALCAHRLRLRCKGSGLLLLVHTVTNARVYAAKVS